MQLALLMVATFATAMLSAVAGFGGGALLLPIFVTVLGARDAVAVLTITQVASNGSRVWLNRAEIDTRLVTMYAAGAVPAAVAGALLLSHAPLRALTFVMGAFLLILVLWRRIRPGSTRVSDAAFIGIGAASGFGSALIGSVGGLTAPFFLARGLVRGAYIGTEAASTLIMHVTKLVVFSAAAVLTLHTGLIGLALTPASAAGAWAGKRIVDRLPIRIFVLLVEAGLVAAGVLLIVS